jgi:hypothetical protein
MAGRGGTAVHQPARLVGHPYFEQIRGMEVSAHFFMRRDGELIQFVDADRRAWHAGVSCWRGRERCNDDSIGIELEGLEGQTFEAAQYRTLSWLCSQLATRYPIAHVAGHEHIAPHRKLDPGAGYQIIRRNGAVVPFEPNKIAVALMKAFLAVHGTQGAASASVRQQDVEVLTQAVVRALMRSRPGGGTFHIEDVQDQVELGLMRGGHHEVARAYVLYRERRAQERAPRPKPPPPADPTLHVLDGGQRVPLDIRACTR